MKRANKILFLPSSVKMQLHVKYCRINKREKSTLSASVHVIFFELFYMRVEKASVFDKIFNLVFLLCFFCN